jgi:hypothetical protein
MGGDALVAGAQDRVPAGEAAQRREAAAGIALVARRRHIAEVAAPHPLAQGAAQRGHIPQLRRGSQQQRLRDDRETRHHAGRPGNVAHPRRRADAKATAGQVLDPVQGEVVDVDQQPGPQHVLAYQVDLGGAAGQKRAVTVFPDHRDRAVDIRNRA